MEQRWLDTDRLAEVDPDLLRRFSDREGVPLPKGDAPTFTRTAWLLGFLTWTMRDLALRHPTWPVVRYEDAVIDPAQCFAELSSSIGITWDSVAQRRMAANARVAESRRAALHRTLSRWDRRELLAVLEPFGLGDWSPC
jgi:hypothetical protein